MQFSIFKNQLRSWQGRSLIVGLNKDDIDSQLKKIDFIVKPKEITKNLIIITSKERQEAQ